MQWEGVLGRDAGATRGRATTCDALRAGCVQAADLFYVVHAVEQVKLPPLGCGERTKDRVIEEFAVGPKFFFAARHQVIHFSNLGANLGQHFLQGNAARPSHGRGFPACGEIAESQDDERLRPLLPGLSGGQRLTGFGDAGKSLQRSGVG